MIFSEYIYRLYPESTIDACRNITLQVCDDCCLNCSYCYQICKGKNYMNKETAKQIVDLLFKMYYDDIPDAFINKSTHGLIIDFIGGEPLMNIDILDYTCTYFLNKCLELDHEWMYNSRFSFATNGMLYFEPRIQAFLKKFNKFISLTVSIDGPKEIHDICRKDYNGKGSFDTAYKAMKHWITYYNTENYRGDTKVTIAPENLHNLNKIIDFFINDGITEIHANPIYEEKWTPEQAKQYYKELIILADKLLDNPNVTCSIFNEMHNRPMKFSDDRNWCGGDGNMLAFDPFGKAYPCLRYMESSLGDSVPPIIVGDVKTGIYNTEETKQIKKNLNAITRRNQSTDECFHCPIASGCAWCSAYNYQEHKCLNKRSTNICWMHRASALANVYYWNKKYISEDSQKRVPIFLQQEHALKIITAEEYDYLLEISIC